MHDCKGRETWVIVGMAFIVMTRHNNVSVVLKKIKIKRWQTKCAHNVTSPVQQALEIETREE